MRLRPCIDLHDGQVKQIVGSSIRDEQGRSARYDLGGVRENFVSFEDAAHYAAIYREKNLSGGHIILLNSKERQPELYEVDRQQALAALRAYPGGMQAGGGMTPENAADFLDAGASHVIVTGGRSGAPCAGSLLPPKGERELYSRDGPLAEGDQSHSGQPHARDTERGVRRISYPCGGCRGETRGHGAAACQDSGAVARAETERGKNGFCRDLCRRHPFARGRAPFKTGVRRQT